MSSQRCKVLKTVTPLTKVGNMLVPPNWRYNALFNPAKYKLKEFANRSPVAGHSSLKRFLNIGLTFDINYTMSDSLKQIYRLISPENKSFFLAIWNRSFKRKGIKKVTIQPDAATFQRNPVWNIKGVEYINDTFLRRLILHHSNYQFDKHIAYALELGRNEEYAEIFKFIGYCIFAKIPDEKIAIRWKVPVSHITALRMIFFDFSFFPNDRIATMSHLRQLTNNGLFNDLDFVYYKRVFELGELGLKAQTDFYNLNPAEKKQVEEFLGKSIVSNALNLQFSIKNQKDAVEYGAVIGALSNYYSKNIEKAYFESKIRNLDATTRKIEGDMYDNSKAGLSEIDLKYMDLLTQNSLHEDRLEYKTLDMLNKA